jgi:NAD(P)H-flavin reductase
MVGGVHRILADFQDLGDCDLYVNGPPAFIAAARSLFIEKGLPESRLFVDAIKRIY